MGIPIEDGTGKGYQAGVSEENRLLSECVTSTNEHHVNHAHSQAYNVYFSQSPTANDDCIFFIENTNDVDLCVEGLKLSVDGACEVYCQINDKGTRLSATAVTPTNLNGGSGNSADGTFEKGADLDGATSTITGGTEFERIKLIAATPTESFNFEQDVILPKNSTMTIWCDTSTVTVDGTVIFNYHGLDIG